MVSVDAIVIEGQFFSQRMRVLGSHTLEAFQNRHGYEVFRLDTFDKRRLINRYGWDVTSKPGTIEALDRIRRLKRDQHEFLDEAIFGYKSPS